MYHASQFLKYLAGISQVQNNQPSNTADICHLPNWDLRIMHRRKLAGGSTVEPPN